MKISEQNILRKGILIGSVQRQRDKCNSVIRTKEVG